MCQNVEFFACRHVIAVRKYADVQAGNQCSAFVDSRTCRGTIEQLLPRLFLLRKWSRSAFLRSITQQSCRMADFFPRNLPVELQNGAPRVLEIAIREFNRSAAFESLRNSHSQ